jgi:nucleotide-binding universal stress UspA family protein
VAEAALHGAELTAVLCWGYLDQHHGPGGPKPFDPEYSNADAARALDATVVAAVGEQAAPSVVRRVVNDLPAPGLLDVAGGADLLVVGARGLGRFRELLVGSVSHRCVVHAQVPVAVIRPLDGTPRAAPRVVVGVDGSETSRRALQWAVREARLRNATVEAVHAWSMPNVGELYVPVSDGAVTNMERASAELLAEAVSTVDAEGLPGPIVQTVMCGSGGAVLIDAAAEADLVVVGSRGLGGFKGLLLGSVGHQVTHHAACPVVVIPHVE